MSTKKVCIMGLGYIGLPTAALLANRGHSVVGVDVKQEVVETINQGKIHIVEPDLHTFVKAAVDSGSLRAQMQPQEADVFFICVPTPFVKGTVNNDPDMTYVNQAAEKIAPFVRAGNMVILESTSPVGSTEMVRDTLAASGVDTDSVAIAYCPERVLPGRIMHELVENDRIVGGINPESTKMVAEFYDTFVMGEVLRTDSRTAEMTKLVENSSRDVQIAFANELSIICDKLGINVWELIGLANRHPRVNILNPGTGVGGHCIAVDPWFLVSKTPEEAKIIRRAREINDSKTDWVIEKIQAAAKELGSNPVVACMGIAFKPDIDDLRESPALRVAESLQKAGVRIVVCEPNIRRHESFELVDSMTAVQQSDLVVFLVSHREFLDLPVPAEKKTLDFCGVRKC